MSEEQFKNSSFRLSEVFSQSFLHCDKILEGAVSLVAGLNCLKNENNNQNKKTSGMCLKDVSGNKNFFFFHNLHEFTTVFTWVCGITSSHTHTHPFVFCGRLGTEG